MKYSVIIPCYNAEKSIAKAMYSIINQSYKDIELIVINDGSTDDSEKAIFDVIKNNPTFKILYKKINNSGPAVARNTGIDLATGDFVAFLDSDDYYDKNLFQEISEKDEEFDICYFGWKETYEDETQVFSIYSKLYNFLETPISGKEAAIKKYNCWLWLCNCNEVYSLKMINDNHIRYPDGVYAGEDTAFIYKCLCHAQKVASLNKDYFHNIIRPNSLMHAKFNEKSLTLFKGINELYEYSKVHFDDELTAIFYSLYYYSQVIIAKKISEQYRWFNFVKFSKDCKKYIPKLKKERKINISKKKKIELSIYRFSKPLFLMMYKVLKG